MEKHIIQKYRNNLATNGMALILFGLWDVLYAITSILYRNAMFEKGFEKVNPEALVYARIAFYVMIIIAMFIGLGTRLIIGTRAMREGRLLGHHYRYYKFCVILCVLYIANAVFIIQDILRGTFVVENVLSLIGALVSFYIIAQILRSTGVLRRYEKQMLNEQNKG